MLDRDAQVSLSPVNEKAKLRLRSVLQGSFYSFVFPIVFIMILPDSPISFGHALICGLVNAVIAGPLMAYLFTVMVPWTRRFRFLIAISVQISVFLTAGIGFTWINVALLTALTSGRSFTDPRVFELTNELLLSGGMRFAFLIGVLLFIAIAMFQQVAQKLGPKFILFWLTGKYHTPREEEWVFMFLDLKDSTPLAERLGSLEFSALVRDFFDDVGWAILATKGTVSHYIGDEAVIVWRPRDAFRDARCLKLFFLAEQEIAKRADYYQDRYGVVPSFKAGVHMGPVVVTEVGRAKSEIVFHGDAVNATARITGLCSTLERDFLISDLVAGRLPECDFVLEPLGKHELKGKSESLGIIAVSSSSH